MREKNNAKIVECQYCGKKYEQYRIIQKYCSRSCWKKGYRKKSKEEEKQCPVCGKAFMTSKSYKKYCSDLCRISFADKNKIVADELRLKQMEQRRLKQIETKRLDEGLKWRPLDKNCSEQYKTLCCTCRIAGLGECTLLRFNQPPNGSKYDKTMIMLDGKAKALYNIKYCPYYCTEDKIYTGRN